MALGGAQNATGPGKARAIPPSVINLSSVPPCTFKVIVLRVPRQRQIVQDRAVMELA